MDGDDAPLASTRALCRATGAPLDRGRGACGRHLRRARQRADRAAGVGRRRARVGQYGGQGAGRRRRVRRRPGMGDRVSGAARAAVRVFDGAAAGDGATRSTRASTIVAARARAPRAARCALARHLRARLRAAGVDCRRRRFADHPGHASATTTRAVAVAAALQAGLRRPRDPAADRARRDRAAARLGEHRPRPTSMLDQLRRRLLVVRAQEARASAPRPLRNRHRHRRRQDGGVGRADAPLRPHRVRCATGSRCRPGIEQDDDTADGAAAGGMRVADACSTTACGCRDRCRRIWRRALQRHGRSRSSRCSTHGRDAAGDRALDRRRRGRRAGADQRIAS